MGDPKKHRKKYTTPLHPWVKERLESEITLSKDYGTKNKKEIYRMDSFLRNIKSKIKQLHSSSSQQAIKEKDQLLTRLKKLNLIGTDASVDAVLGLEIKNVMDRRLQSIVHKKGLANSVKQARQFITHQHIVVGNQKITSPSYIVSGDEEKNISFVASSSLSNPEHPERAVTTKDIKKEVEQTKPTKSEIEENGPGIPELTEEDAKSIEEAVAKEVEAVEEETTEPVKDEGAKK